MLDTKDKVYAKLNEMGITYDVVEHKPIFTIEEMENLNLENEDKVIKNIFIRDDKKRNYYLVLVAKDKRLDLKNLKEKLGTRPLGFASENDLYKYLGLTKGSVTPLGILNDKDLKVEVIIDEDLKAYDIIGVHPNDNHATIFLSFTSLLNIIQNNGNKYRYLEL